MNSEPIHVFGHQNIQRLCLGLSSYDTQIISLHRLSRKSAVEPLQVDADRLTQEHNTKRAVSFTYRKKPVLNTF